MEVRLQRVHAQLEIGAATPVPPGVPLFYPVFEFGGMAPIPIGRIGVATPKKLLDHFLEVAKCTIQADGVATVVFLNAIFFLYIFLFNRPENPKYS